MTMIVRTANATYEVRENERRFRRLHQPVREGGPADGGWQDFEFMSPIVREQPLRFFWREHASSGGGDLRARVWSTTAVSEVVRHDDRPAGSCAIG